MSSYEYVVVLPGGGWLGVTPDAWRTTGRPAWRLEMIRQGWRRCPDNIWRHPAAWPPLRLP